MSTKTGKSASGMLAGAALFVASCASTQESQTQKSAADGRQYEATGAAQACVRPRDVDAITALDDRTLIFRTGPSTYFRNYVGPGCKNAASPFRRFQYDVYGGSLCKGETINLVNNDDNIIAGFCRLGEFEQVQLVK